MPIQSGFSIVCSPLPHSLPCLSSFPPILAAPHHQRRQDSAVSSMASTLLRRGRGRGDPPKAQSVAQVALAAMGQAKSGGMTAAVAAEGAAAGQDGGHGATQGTAGGGAGAGGNSEGEGEGVEGVPAQGATAADGFFAGGSWFQGRASACGCNYACV